jgi:hypothetical protein
MFTASFVASRGPDSARSPRHKCRGLRRLHRFMHEEYRDSSVGIATTYRRGGGGGVVSREG